MKFKFKIGDKVRIISDYNGDLRKYSHLTINKCINLFGFGTPWYEVAEDDGDAIIKEDDLELIEEAESVKLKYTKPTKVELFNMPLGTRIFTDAKGINGEDNAFIFDGKDFDSPHFRIPPTTISDELKIIYNDFPDVSPIVGTHIIKIEVPTDYETVYEEYNIEDLRKENDWLHKKNKALEEIVAELQEKLKQANINADISKQESDIADIFFNKED